MSLAMLDSVRIGKLRRRAPLCRRERKYARCHGIEALERREMMAADVVIDWNNHTLAAIRATNTAPPIASRALAIVHTAIYDAVNAIDRAYQPYAVDVVALPDSSREAAVAAAAQRALSSLFPSQSSAFTTALTASLAAIPDGEAEDHGVALGLSVADRILALRANDGSATAVNYTPVGGIGQWRPTPPANAPALLPQWANVAPWAMKSPSQFDPQGIPALTSAAYAAAVNEVKNYGAATGSLRTEDQTAIAKFWANGVGTSTPPGHLNVMAQVVAEN